MTALDQPTLTDWYDRYARPILARCRAVCGNPTDAEEVLQETFLRAWQARHRYRNDNPLAWLHTIAYRASIDRIRDRTRMSAATWVGEIAAHLVDPEHRIDAERILSRFSADDGVLLRLRHVEGWDLEEVAEHVGMSRRTLSRRLERLEQRARAAARIAEPS